MIATGVGSNAGGEGGLADPEALKGEDATVAPVADGFAGDVAVEEEELVSPLRPEDQPPTAEQRAQWGRELNAFFEDEERREGQQGAESSVEVASDDVDTEVIGETEPANDAADEGDAAVRPGEGTLAAETLEASGTRGSDSSPAADGLANSSGEGEAAADEQVVPQLSKQALESLLDESTGKLVALEDFECEVDDRARENEWLGKHTKISLAVFRAELDRTGKHTVNVDGNGVLLDDPVKFRLAREAGAQITLRVHRGLSEAKKSNFILLTQGRGRDRTEAENREWKRRIILAGLVQGWTYEATAEMAGVHANTVRNIETRAANDPNSKLVNTKKDRRLTWSTPENVAEAHRLRAEEKKNNSQIAKALGTTPATIGKLFKAPSPEAKAKSEEEPNPTPETAPDQSPPPPPQVTDTRVPDDSIPNVVRLLLERRGLRGVPAAKEYAELLKPQQDDARETVEAIAKFDDQLLPSFLYHQAAAALLEVELEKHLLATGKEGAA